MQGAQHATTCGRPPAGTPAGADNCRGDGSSRGALAEGDKRERLQFTTLRCVAFRKRGASQKEILTAHYGFSRARGRSRVLLFASRLVLHLEVKHYPIENDYAGRAVQALVEASAFYTAVKNARPAESFSHRTARWILLQNPRSCDAE